MLTSFPMPACDSVATRLVDREPGMDLAEAVSHETVRACVLRFADRIRSIVLTGSLARSEGSFLKTPSGWTLMGDAEYFVVLDHIKDLSCKSEVARLKNQIEKSLARHGLSCSVSLAISDASFFRGLKPHIFAYELRNHGKAVLGDPTVLELIPPFSAADISLEDGWRLLANRLVEQLEVLASSDTASSVLPEALFYRTVKLYLDMATSFLLFTGKYEPSYRARCERLKSVSPEHGTSPAPFDLEQFAKQVAACTDWKLAPSRETEPGSGWTFWLSSHHHASRLWNWELSRLQGTSCPLSETLMLPSGRQQAITTKLRGWAYVVREAGWQETRKRWSTWAAQVAGASPRYRVYSAAGELYSLLPAILSGERQPCETNDRIRRIHHWLPVADSQPNGDWRALARAVAYNYHAFLENTRA